MPVGPYDSFDECVADNQDKDDPGAFCGWLKQQSSAVEDLDVPGGGDLPEAYRPAEVEGVNCGSCVFLNWEVRDTEGQGWCVYWEAFVADDHVCDAWKPGDEVDEGAEMSVKRQVRVSTPATRGSFATVTDDEIGTMDLAVSGDETRWEGVIAVEEQMTGDGRMFTSGALRWETLPVPLRWVREDEGEHLGAVVVGRIDEVYRDGNNIMGRGVFDMGSEDGIEAARQVAEGLTPGISVDLDDVSFEIRVRDSVLQDADPSEIEVDESGMATVMRFDSDDEVMVTTDARLRAATIVATPAFAEARIYIVDELYLHDEDEDESMAVFSLSAEERTPTAGMAEDAQRALDWRAEGHSGGEDNTVQRARSIAAREPLSAETVRRMHNFFSRNASYPTLDGFSPGDDGFPSAARVAWGLWGGDAGATWSSTLVDRMGRQEGSVVASTFQIRTGSFVEWSWQDGTAQGKVERVVTEGQLEVPGTDTTINADEDNPAVLIESWRRVELEAGEFYEPTGSMVGRRMDALTAIEPLRERPASASLRASSVGVKPPAEWFRDPKLGGATPITVTEDGRVFGHLATWGTCHTGFVGECVQPPSSASNYAYFRTGSVRTADGSEVAVGRLTLDTTHAGRRLGATDTAAHYEHTGVAVADVSAGEDVHGIWVAGALRPGVSEEQVRALMASPLSGDWRRIGGQLELVAALAVNSPGFPIPRVLVAGGAVRTLQASGVVAAIPEQVEALSDSEDEILLARLIERERAMLRDQRKQAAAARNRIRSASAQARFRRAIKG